MKEFVTTCHLTLSTAINIASFHEDSIITLPVWWYFYGAWTLWLSTEQKISLKLV